ncbi:STAS domain-containing protein [Nonomuraea gerenzanensis]|uniref:RsbR, positive regulator of sigma-B n=1 Tax=Nonomuraea gerenzanensis TaxID=93944 RepID=A0A1M4EM69_9ACTN|nr:STAS domain-containing protein [Nonomuraea gerenzanensis]UBU11458.1 STAS domain-containing protein [Nonomuraea gerenzanensis]SBO99942.1 RsbR, positive regulator of sigma-B [Nonomuraea gerenzanensis]
MTVHGEADRLRMEVLLKERGEAILKRWIDLAAVSGGGHADRVLLAGRLTEIHHALCRSLEQDGDTSDLRGLLAELSRGQAREGFTPSDTATVVFSLKQAVYEAVESDEDTGTLRGYIWFSRYVDELGLFTFETYVTARERIISGQAEQLLELSTPVVKLWDGILAVPLVGTLDSARTQVVMEKLLQALVETGAGHAVIDITGVPAVDTEVAQHLLKTVVAARLMGAECVVSGIRPQIAQTIVALGIQFGDIITKSSLADALAHALRRSGVRVPGAADQLAGAASERS